MIDETLIYLSREMNRHLKARFPGDGDRVALSPLSIPGGRRPPPTVNRIVITLVNIEQDAVLRPGQPIRGSAPETGAGLHINLHLLISASFEEDYPESLKQLSEVLSWLQQRPLFAAATDADLPPGLEQLSVEFVNLDFEQQRALWSTIGSSYLPSAVYRVRIQTRVQADPAGAGTQTHQ